MALSISDVKWLRKRFQRIEDRLRDAEELQRELTELREALAQGNAASDSKEQQERDKV